jgi:tetratricopeptide (TPR) repeat protein
MGNGNVVRMTSKAPFGSAHVSELDAIPITDTLVWRPVRRRFDIRAFGVNAYTARNAGDELVENHDETGGGAGHHEELYFVAAGHARFTVAGEEIDAPAGTFVFVRDPRVRRQAVATKADSTVLAIGGARAQPFRPSPWEHYFAAIPYAREGDYAKARETVAAGLEEHPDNASLLYNLACYESLAGEDESALANLQRAVELDPGLREHARSDSDLDRIRGHPDFAV